MTTMNNQLGPFISEHGASKIRRNGNLWSGIVFVILGLIALGAGLIAAVTDTGSNVFTFMALTNQISGQR